MFYKVTREDVPGVSTWFIRLEKGEEILHSFTGFCKKFISYTGATGTITGIGAINYAEIGWFDPEYKKYLTKAIQENLEITSLVGNLSLKEKEPFFHIHVTLSNQQFQVLGGHLHKAIISATGEFVLRTFRAPLIGMKRKLDEETGLYLWDEMLKLDEFG